MLSLLSYMHTPTLSLSLSLSLSPQSGPKEVIPLIYANVVLHIPEFAILKNNSMLIIYYDETRKKTRNIFVKADTSYVSKVMFTCDCDC